MRRYTKNCMKNSKQQTHSKGIENIISHVDNVLLLDCFFKYASFVTADMGATGSIILPNTPYAENTAKD